MAANSFQFDAPGANPFTLYGPAVTASGIPQPQMKPGTVMRGDREAEYVLCALTLASTTNFTNGQLYQWDKDYNASLVTTSAAVRGYSCGVNQVVQTGVTAGTYYIWLLRAGHGPVVATGSAASAAETTATAGTVNFTNTPTTGAKTVVGLTFYAAATFTASTTNTSNTLTNISSINDLYVGQTVAGTGIPGATTITAINALGGGGYTLTLSANATATGTGVTITPSGVLTANVLWPVIDKTN